MNCKTPVLVCVLVVCLLMPICEKHMSGVERVKMRYTLADSVRLACTF